MKKVGKGIESLHAVFELYFLVYKWSQSMTFLFFFFCRRKGSYLNFQMDLLLQESLSKKKAITLDLNLRELEGVFTSLNTS